jgi:hypothetical protein
MQATPARPAGCPHFGLDVENLDAYVGQLKQRGVDGACPRQSVRARARRSRLRRAGRHHMELLEMGPNSLHRKAINDWK